MGIADSYPGKWLPIGVDGQRVVILEEDEQTHIGTRYTALNLQTVAASGESNIAITPNGVREIHLAVTLDCTKAGTWRMSECAIVSGGSAVTAYNNNRKSTNTCSCTIVAGPTITTIGTVLGYHVIGSSTGGASKSGGNSGSRNEWILSANTCYLFTLTSVAADNLVVQGLYFYEEDI